MGSKIGIVFAFLLSALAAYGAYYLYQTLSEERGFRLTIEQKYDETKERVQTLQSEKEQIKVAKDQLQTDSEEYQRKVQDAESQLTQIKDEASKAASAKADLEQQLKEKDERLAAMEKKVAELQKQAEEVMRACKVTPSDLKASLVSGAPMSEEQAVTTASSEGLAFSSPGMTATAPAEEVAPSTREEKEVAPEAVTAEAPEPEAVASAPALAPSPAPAQTGIQTGPKVLTVNRKFNFVVINIGLKDGLKMGDQLKVVKGGADSATIQVEKLYDRFSAATILDEDAKNQVVEGDAVRKV